MHAPMTLKAGSDGPAGPFQLTARFWYLLVVLAIVITAAVLAYASGLIGRDAGQVSGWEAVDLDSYINDQKPQEAGTRTIVRPQNILFMAKPKSRPERIEVAYLYTALSMMKVDPLPVVNHQMFVESDGGRIIAVYVEDRFIDQINAEIESEAMAEFRGYHVYNYAKGPAIVVVGVSQ